MKIISLKQRTKPWLDYRRTKIMASDSGIILGSSPFKDKEQLLTEKIRGFETVPNSYMKRGLDLEPIALQKFESETGLILFPCIGEHENGWMAASFDGMTIDGDAIVEIKAPGKKDHTQALEGKIPKKYFPQLQHQIHVSGLDFSYYYSFDGENGVTIEVKRDQEFIEKMIEKEFEFWQCLQTLTPPHNDKKRNHKYETADTIS